MFRNKHKKLTSLLTTLLILIYQVISIRPVVYAQTPTPPPPPSAPQAPQSPTPPEPPQSPQPPSPGGSDDQAESNQDDDQSENEDQAEQTSNDSNQQHPTQQTTGQNQPAQGSTPQTQTSPTVGDSQVNTGNANNNINAFNDANANTQANPAGSGSGAGAANTGNGTNSDNDNTINLSSDSITVQDNKAALGNNVDGGSNSGANSNSANVGNSHTDTGTANTTATIITSANTNTDGIIANEFNVVDDHVGDIILDVNNPCPSGCQTGEVVVLGNQQNGSNSTNNNKLNAHTTDQTFQNNDADVENNIVLGANSGDNISNDNTGGDTSIKTGDANVVANVVSFLNNNIAGNVVINTVNVLGSLVGDIIAPQNSFQAGCDSGCGSSGGESLANAGNGSDSDNSNTFNSSSSDLLLQDNDAQISNNLDLAATTGDNQTKDNTGGNSSIKTGDTNVDVNVLNIANQNVATGDWWIVLVNQAGEWIGQIVGSPDGANMGGSQGTQFKINPDGSITALNTGNGSNSDNDNQIDQTSRSTLVQTNSATLSNNLDLSANTGSNQASRNTGGNSTIDTGDANIMANLVNFVNNNISGDANVMVTVVNVFGSWIGDFVGPDQQPRAESPAANQQASASQSNSNQGDSLEIGGVQVESNNPDSNSSESGGNLLPITTTSTVAQQFLSNSNSPLFGETRSSRTGSVFGQTTTLTEKLDSSVDQINETIAPSKSKIKIKITWPAIITSLLGVAYAAIKAKAMLA